MQQAGRALRAWGLSKDVEQEGMTSRSHFSYSKHGQLLGAYGADVRRQEADQGAKGGALIVQCFFSGNSGNSNSCHGQLDALSFFRKFKEVGISPGEFLAFFRPPIIVYTIFNN